MQKPSDLITQLCEGRLSLEERDYLRAVGSMLGHPREDSRITGWALAEEMLSRKNHERWLDLVLHHYRHVTPGQEEEYLLIIAMYLHQVEEENEPS